MVDFCRPVTVASRTSGSSRNGHHPEQAPYSAATPSGANGTGPGNIRRNKPYLVDGVNDGVSTRSCMSIFSSNHQQQQQQQQQQFFKKKGLSFVASNSKSNSNSSGGPDSQPLFSKQPEEFAVEWESFDQSIEDQQQWYIPPKNSKEEEEEVDEDGFTKSLLQLPKPTDRSHKQRFKLEQERRKAGVYNGEMEPEGLRGQEAPVVLGKMAAATTTTTTTSDAAPLAEMRSFSSPTSSSSAAGAAASPASSASSRGRKNHPPAPSSTNLTRAGNGSNNNFSKRTLETIAEVSGSESDLQSFRSSPSLQHQPQQQQTNTNHHYNHNDTSFNSTSSSISSFTSANSASPTRKWQNHHPNATSSSPSLHIVSPQSINSQSNSSMSNKSRDPLATTTTMTTANTTATSANTTNRTFSVMGDESSTDSDEEIQRMVADFLVQEVTDPADDHDYFGEHQQPSVLDRDYPNLLPVPGRRQDLPFRSTSTSVATMMNNRPASAPTRVIPVTVSESSSSNNSPASTPQRQSTQQQQKQQPPLTVRRGIAPLSQPSEQFASASTGAAAAREAPKRAHFHNPFNDDNDYQDVPLQNQHSPNHQHHPPPHYLEERQLSEQQHPDDEFPTHPQHSHLPSATTTQESVDVWNALALQHVHNGEYDMALAAFQHVLRAYKLRYGDVHPLVASAYHNLGTVHAKRAQLLLDDTLHQRHCRAQSLQCFQSAARAARDSLGRDHPNVAVSLVRIGFLLLQARQYNNAVITFQEALRIRQAFYGPHHPLVANLYNNLGVCYMHLGRFAHGRDLLHHAMSIQRTLLENASQQQQDEEKKDSSAISQTANQSLELADTLFNIGGLALEWIRRQGPDAGHAQEAEEAFEEALELRKNVLGPKDPMVLQVKSLLDMARSIPRPKSPGRRTSVPPAKPTRGNGNVNYPRPQPPDPVGTVSSSARKGDYDTGESPPMGRSTVARDDNSPLFQRSVGLGHDDDSKIEHNHVNNNNNNNEKNNVASASVAQPYRYYSPPRSTAATSSHASSPPRSTATSSPLRYHKQPNYLEPPPTLNNQGRSFMGEYTDNQYDDLGFTTSRLSNVSSAASTVKVSSGRLDTKSMFRKDFEPNKDRSSDTSKLQTPPVMEVTVSQDEDDDGLYDPKALPRPPEQTNVFISPHYIPQMSPHKVNLASSFSENGETTPSSHRTSNNSSFSGMPVSSSPATGALANAYSYDAEESCLLTDGATGTDANASFLSGNYDSPSSNSPSRDDVKDKNSRKIMVVRPYRRGPGESITSPTSVLTSPKKHPWDDDLGRGSEDRMMSAEGANTSNLYSSELEYSSKTSSYARNVRHADRNETLARARALLEATREYMDSPQVQLAGTPPYMSNVHSPDRVKQRLFTETNRADVMNLNEDLEDGLAPLGSTPGTAESKVKKTFHPSMLSNRPGDHLQEIYEEASRRLKNHQYMEAAEFFETILQCQRQHHGPYHQDVAAALHNCGFAHLRAGNHQEALKAFEEAVRIRKGTLGKEHPHVAASLVKCGITFLLLHRFEESLWSFREALSIRKHSLGPLHPSTARIYNNIGCVHVEFNELREARRAFEGALDIQRNALCHDPDSGPVRFGLAATLCNLGYLYRHRGMHERAAQVLREAADIQDHILGETHPTVLSTLDSLAEALTSCGQSMEALRTHEAILERFSSTEAAGSRRLARAEAGLKFKMSRAAKQMNNLDSQIKYLQQALQAVRSLKEETEAAQGQAAALEKRILADLREARGSMEAKDLKWI